MDIFANMNTFRRTKIFVCRYKPVLGMYDKLFHVIKRVRFSNILWANSLSFRKQERCLQEEIQFIHCLGK